MHPTLHGACVVPDTGAMGLYIQHGGQRGSWGATEHLMERFQCTDLSKAEEAIGGVAWIDRGIGRFGYELGAVRFSAVVGIYRCAQLVASGDRGTDDMVVQVSLENSSLLRSLCLTSRLSFLVKDAQQNMAGQRLKA